MIIAPRYKRSVYLQSMLSHWCLDRNQSRPPFELVTFSTDWYHKDCYCMIMLTSVMFATKPAMYHPRKPRGYMRSLVSRSRECNSQKQTKKTMELRSNKAISRALWNPLHVEFHKCLETKISSQCINIPRMTRSKYQFNLILNHIFT